MPSRSTRRRHHKQLATLAELTDRQRSGVARAYLLGWRREAWRRARTADAPAVWDLARDPQVTAIAKTLDLNGELSADLSRICAEAVAGMAGRHLLAGSRPLADRERRNQK